MPPKKGGNGTGNPVVSLMARPPPPPAAGRSTRSQRNVTFFALGSDGHPPAQVYQELRLPVVPHPRAHLRRARNIDVETDDGSTGGSSPQPGSGGSSPQPGSGGSSPQPGSGGTDDEGGRGNGPTIKTEPGSEWSSPQPGSGVSSPQLGSGGSNSGGTSSRVVSEDEEDSPSPGTVLKGVPFFHEHSRSLALTVSGYAGVRTVADHRGGENDADDDVNMDADDDDFEDRMSVDDSDVDMVDASSGAGSPIPGGEKHRRDDDDEDDEDERPPKKQKLQGVGVGGKKHQRDDDDDDDDGEAENRPPMKKQKVESSS